MNLVNDTVLNLGAGLLIGLLAATLYVQIWKIRYTRGVRRDASRRSAAVTAGLVYEQLVPWLPGFKFDPRDARFLGSPVDFVVFDGLSAGTVRRVVFVEMKTGRSDLSTRERRVRDAIVAGRVEWIEHRADAD